MNYKVTYKKLLADQHTPVALYLKLRDRFNESILLESSDYHSKENSLSILCAQPLLTFSIQDHQLLTKSHQTYESETIGDDSVQQFRDKVNAISIEKPTEVEPFLGVFDHSTFDSYQYFEDFHFDAEKRKVDIPVLQYSLYQFILVFNHFTDTLLLIEIQEEGQESAFEALETLINS